MLRFAEYLELQDFRQTTAANYYRALRLLSEHFDCDPSVLTEEQLRSNFVHVRSVLNWAPKSCRQHLAGLKHFFRGMLELGFASLDQIKARDRETLPTVLTPEEVARVLSAVPLLRYQMPLLLIYACGLGVRECVNLTVNDIDGPGNRLFIRDGKGGKDRYTILATPVYEALKRYWPHHKNRKLLFPAVRRGLRDSAGAAAHMAIATEPMDSNSLRTHLRKAAQKVGVTKKVTCHILRHSFATHLAAMGVPLHQIQSYLGHEHHAFHSCNHRLCPRCGAADTQAWGARQLGRLLPVPYYMVTFTLPEELRSVLRGRREAMELLMRCSAQTLSELLADPKRLGFTRSGFFGVYQSWT